MSGVIVYGGFSIFIVYIELLDRGFKHAAMTVVPHSG